ncbi:hypothetical protein RRF55_28240, partial [Klebsiella sp. K47]|uniref:hypothetical protein n=1 Tax=Klebsiella sp. K47 TaxID=3077736 RepID=UPI003F46973B
PALWCRVPSGHGSAQAGLRSTAFEGQFRLATLDEIIAFLVQQAGRANRGIWLVPEIKHGTYFTRIGLPMEDKVGAAL